MPAHPQLIATRDLACGVDVTGLEDLPGLDQLPRYRDGGVPAGLLADHVEGIDLTQLDADTDVLNVAVLTDRLISWAQAMHLAALAELTCRPETLRGDGPREPAPTRLDGTLVREHAADEVGAALGMTSRAAQSRVWTAMPLCTQFPGTWTALAAGRIDYLRMHALVEEAGGIADDEVLAQVEDRLLARRPGRSPGEFRTAVRRAVLRADADAAKARAEQARADTYVRTRPAQTDTAWLDAHLPAEDALAIRLVLDAAAAAMRGQGEGRSADQLRAAALAAPFWQALATGQLSTIDGPLDLAVAHGQAPTLDLDLHPDESTVELRGYGPITAVLGREVAARPRWAPSHGPRPPARHRRRRDRRR